MGNNKKRNNDNSSSNLSFKMKKCFEIIKENSLKQYIDTWSFNGYNYDEQNEHKRLIIHIPVMLNNYIKSLIDLGFISDLRQLEIIVNKLSNLKFIYFYKKNSGNRMDIMDNVLYLSPENYSAKNLKGEDLFQLNLYIILTKYLHLNWKNDFIASKVKVSKEDCEFLYSYLVDPEVAFDKGLKNLDDLLSQEIAERVFYNAKKKTRPIKTESLTPDGKVYYSNWIYNPEKLPLLERYANYLFGNGNGYTGVIGVSNGLENDLVTKSNVNSLCSLSFDQSFMDEMFKKSGNDISFLSTLASLGNNGEGVITKSDIGVGNSSIDSRDIKDSAFRKNSVRSRNHYYSG